MLHRIAPASSLRDTAAQEVSTSSDTLKLRSNGESHSADCTVCRRGDDFIVHAQNSTALQLSNFDKSCFLFAHHFGEEDYAMYFNVGKKCNKKWRPGDSDCTVIAADKVCVTDWAVKGHSGGLWSPPLFELGVIDCASRSPLRQDPVNVRTAATPTGSCQLTCSHLVWRLLTLVWISLKTLVFLSHSNQPPLSPSSPSYPLLNKQPTVFIWRIHYNHWHHHYGSHQPPLRSCSYCWPLCSEPVMPSGADAHKTGASSLPRDPKWLPIRPQLWLNATHHSCHHHHSHLSNKGSSEFNNHDMLERIHIRRGQTSFQKKFQPSHRMQDLDSL